MADKSSWAKPFSVANPPSSSRYTSEKEWAALKDRILELYTKENLTLKDVSAKIYQETGFEATIQAYKYRIRTWGKKTDSKLKHIMLTASQRQSISSVLSQRGLLEKHSEIRFKDGTKIQNQGRILRTIERHRAEDAKNALPVASPGELCVVTPSPRNDLDDDIGISTDSHDDFSELDELIPSSKNTSRVSPTHQVLPAKPSTPTENGAVNMATDSWSSTCSDDSFPIEQLEMYYGEMKAMTITAFPSETASHDGLEAAARGCSSLIAPAGNLPTLDENVLREFMHPWIADADITAAKPYMELMLPMISMLKSACQTGKIHPQISFRTRKCWSDEEKALSGSISNLQLKGSKAFMAGDFKDAVRCFQTALHVQHGSNLILKESYSDTMVQFFMLAVITARTEQKALALYYYHAALELQKKALGDFHLDSISVREKMLIGASEVDKSRWVNVSAFLRPTYDEYLRCWEGVLFKELEDLDDDSPPSQLDEILDSITTAFTLSSIKRFEASQLSVYIASFDHLYSRLSTAETRYLTQNPFVACPMKGHFFFVSKQILLWCKAYVLVASDRFSDAMESLTVACNWKDTLLEDATLDYQGLVYLGLFHIQIGRRSFSEAEKALRKLSESCGGTLAYNGLWDCKGCGRIENHSADDVYRYICLECTDVKPVGCLTCIDWVFDTHEHPRTSFITISTDCSISRVI